MMKTDKPTFLSVGDMASRLLRVVRNGHRLRHLSSDFRERLMLTVTGVNDCRYCRFVHTGAARVSGLSEGEVAALLEGDFSLSPSKERPALEWARQWAKDGGQTNDDQRAALESNYPEVTARAIVAALEAITIGNFTGNGLDRIIGRIG